MFTNDVSFTGKNLGQGQVTGDEPARSETECDTEDEARSAESSVSHSVKLLAGESPVT